MLQEHMVIFTSADWRERCEKILEVFAYQAPRFYHKEDRRRQVSRPPASIDHEVDGSE